MANGRTDGRKDTSWPSDGRKENALIFLTDGQTPKDRYGGYEQGLILNHTLLLENQKAKASLKHHTWTNRQMDGTTDQATD